MAPMIDEGRREIVCECGHVERPRHGPMGRGVCDVPKCNCGEFRLTATVVPAVWRALGFDVVADPVAQGDLSAAGGRGKGRTRLYHANGKALTPYRNTVAEAAARIVAGRALLEGPVRVNLEFRIGRPRAHFRTGRAALGLSLLRPGAPEAWDCTGGADLDKLARAVLDALTGVAYVDDRQVADLRARRVWAVRGGVSIAVSELNPNVLGV